MKRNKYTKEILEPIVKISKSWADVCKLTEWNGEKIPLELDHKDSNHFNNNIDNLQVICPNCHAIETSKRRKK